MAMDPEEKEARADGWLTFRDAATGQEIVVPYTCHVGIRAVAPQGMKALKSNRCPQCGGALLLRKVLSTVEEWEIYSDGSCGRKRSAGSANPADTYLHCTDCRLDLEASVVSDRLIFHEVYVPPE